MSRPLCLVRQALARHETRIFTRPTCQPLTAEISMIARNFEGVPRKGTVRGETTRMRVAGRYALRVRFRVMTRKSAWHELPCEQRIATPCDEGAGVRRCVDRAECVATQRTMQHTGGAAWPKQGRRAPPWQTLSFTAREQMPALSNCLARQTLSS